MSKVQGPQNPCNLLLMAALILQCVFGNMDEICEKCLKAGESNCAKVWASEKPHDVKPPNIAEESNRDPDEFLQLVDAIIRFQEAHSIPAEPCHDLNERILRVVNDTFQIQDEDPTTKPEQVAQYLRTNWQIHWSRMTLDTNDTKNTLEWEENGDAEKEESRPMEDIFRSKSTCSVAEPPPQYKGQPTTAERFPDTGYNSQPLILQEYENSHSHEHTVMDMTSVQPRYPGDSYLDSVEPGLGSSASSTQPMNYPHNPPVPRQQSDVIYPGHPIANSYNPRVIHLVNAAEAVQMAANERNVGLYTASTSNNRLGFGSSHDGSTTYPSSNFLHLPDVPFNWQYPSGNQ